MKRMPVTHPSVAVLLLCGCAASTPPTDPRPASSLEVPTPSAPSWVGELLGKEVGAEGAAAAKARLFRAEDDAEAFAGLVAFARARDPELRRLAAWHLSGAIPFAEHLGVPASGAIESLRHDGDPEVRRLARLHADADEEGTKPLGIVRGEVRVGGEATVPYPGLPGVRVHLLVKGIDWDAGPWSPSVHYWAEGRTERGDVLGGAGSHSKPDMTASHFMGFATDDAQYGFDLWFRVVDGSTVRWWLRALKKPAT